MADRPELVGGLLRGRSDAVIDLEAPVAAVPQSVIAGRPAAGRFGAIVDEEVGGRPPLRGLPAIEVGCFSAEFGVSAGGGHVDHLARHPHGVAFAAILHHGVLRDRCVADRRRMEVGDVRQLEQIVDDQQVVGLDVEMNLGDPPIGVAETRKIDDQVVVRVFDIAHPHIDEAVALDDGVRLHRQIRRPPRLAGDLDAIAAAVVRETVVAAFDGVADDVALRQGQPPVGAAVFQCDRGAVALSVQDDVFVQHRDRQRVGAEFIAPCRDVPMVSQEHRPLRSVSGVPQVRPNRGAPRSSSSPFAWPTDPGRSAAPAAGRRRAPAVPAH